MQFVPWQRINNWKCTNCGICCKFYNVVLGFDEWFKIVNSYGAGQTVSGLDKLFIRREPDGTCAFLYNFNGKDWCGLQYMKPRACQLWPFKILNTPKHGYPQEAAYPIFGDKLFIYADTTCQGLSYGYPRWEFSKLALKEFVELAAGTRANQLRTTASCGASWPPIRRFRI